MKFVKKLLEQHREEGRFKPVIPHNVQNNPGVSPRDQFSQNVRKHRKMKFDIHQEDLRNWFNPNHPEGGWKRINSKGEAIGPCAREPGEAKPKCMSNAKRASLTKDERAAAVKAKRKHDPNPERKGKPINVSNYGKGKLGESMEQLDEKNAPTNPKLWARAKALARSKFDVYPSAYANGWASKWYKSKGGGWKTISEDKDNLEYADGDMSIHQLKQIKAHVDWILEMLKPDTDMPEWVQAKITLAADYLSTACDYLHVEMNEAVNPAQQAAIAIAMKKEGKKPKNEEVETIEEKGPGLWANIRAKKARGEHMRKPGEKGAPTEAQLKSARNEEVEQMVEYEQFSKPKKEKVVTIKHKTSGKELSVVHTAVPKYQKLGYELVKEGKNPFERKSTNFQTGDGTPEPHSRGVKKEAIDYEKIAKQHLSDFKKKDITSKQREYAEKMHKRAIEAAKMKDDEAAMKHYRTEEVESVDEMAGANMDVRQIHKHLKKSGWDLTRTSGGHDVYTHPKSNEHIAVPRHKHLKAPLVLGILKTAKKVTEEVDENPMEVPKKVPGLNKLKEAKTASIARGILMRKLDTMKLIKTPKPVQPKEPEKPAQPKMTTEELSRKAQIVKNAAKKKEKFIADPVITQTYVKTENS